MFEQAFRNIDHKKARTGDDLREFVDQKIFPRLEGLAFQKELYLR